MSKIIASLFGFDESEIEKAKEENMEEIVFEFGRVMYRLGRLETDEKTGEKEYDKYLKRKEKLASVIGEFFRK